MLEAVKSILSTWPEIRSIYRENGGKPRRTKRKNQGNNPKKKKTQKTKKPGNNPRSLLPNVPVGSARLGLKATGKKQIIINIFTYTLKYNTELGRRAGLGKAWIGKSRLGKTRLVRGSGNGVCFP